MNPLVAPLQQQPLQQQPLQQPAPLAPPAQSSGFNSSDLYTGAAALGKVDSYIYLFFGNLIGWPLLIYALYLIFSKAEPMGEETEEEAKSNRRKLGLILLGVSLLILVLSWGYWWLVKKYKPFAAYAGASAAVDWMTPGPGLGFGGFDLF